MFDMVDRLVTREHVRGLLPILQLGPSERRRLLELPYPLPFPVVEQEFARLGLSLDVLTARMGGSP